jgi:hypothetical protein
VGDEQEGELVVGEGGGCIIYIQGKREGLSIEFLEIGYCIKQTPPYSISPLSHIHPSWKYLDHEQISLVHGYIFYRKW